MKRDAVLSIIIGALSTYLPFWEWSSTFAQITGMFAMGIVAFYVILATEKTDGETDKKKSKRYI